MDVVIDLAFILLFSGSAAISFTWLMNEVSLRSTWICKRIDWHHPPPSMEFDGKDFIGECPRCNKRIRQTMTGSWSRINDE